MNLLKSCRTHWIIANFGVPIAHTMRPSRRECIAAFIDARGWTKKDWEDVRGKSHSCVKVRLTTDHDDQDAQ